MAKLVVHVLFDVTVSDELVGDPPGDRVFEVASEIEEIISAGCAAEGCSYERLPGNTIDDGTDDVYEITENE